MKLRATIIFSKPIVNAGYTKFFHRNGSSTVENSHDNCVFIEKVCIKVKSGRVYHLIPFKKTYTSTMNPPYSSMWVANMNFDIKENFDVKQFLKDIHDIVKITAIKIKYDNDCTDIHNGSFATCLLNMSIDGTPVPEEVIHEFKFPEYDKYGFTTRTVYARIPLEICDSYPVDTNINDIESDMKDKFIKYIKDAVENNPDELLSKFGLTFIHSSKRKR